MRCAAIQFLLTAGLSAEALVPAAHWHHVHINTSQPKASANFYSSKFDCEKARYRDGSEAVWTQKSWILFGPVEKPPPSAIVSPIWHIGWGAEDMPATYQQRRASGTPFHTPLTDISALVGRPEGSFYYAYVDGPSHELIELNTASHHRFGHLHLLSKEPVAAADWYAKHLGIAVRSRQVERRMYQEFPVSPSAALQADNVSILIFPVDYARVSWPQDWNDRQDFESSRGRAFDHIAFSVDDLDTTLARLRGENVKILESMREMRGVKSAMIEGPDHIAIELVEGAAVKP